MLSTILVDIPQTHIKGNSRQTIYATVSFATDRGRNVIQQISFEPEHLAKIYSDEVLVEQIQDAVNTYMEDSEEREPSYQNEEEI